MIGLSAPGPLCAGLFAMKYRVLFVLFASRASIFLVI